MVIIALVYPAFLNPDDLAKEWLEAEAQQAAEEAESVREIYVDEDGNPISKEEYEALMESQEEELEESESEESAGSHAWK